MDDGGKRRTLGDWIRWGAAYLEGAQVCCGHGMAEPLDEAAYLALYAVGLPPQVPQCAFDTVLTDAEATAVEALIHRRVEARCPAAYLTGEAWFCGLRFHVDERVLVPRSPIAELIEAGFAPWLAPNRPLSRILDLGTGSGCIAIACAHAFPQARVDAADISEAALAVSRDNIRLHGLDKRVRAVHSDLFAALDGERYDLIVSNPPYVPEEEMARLPREYRHEPALGLVAADEGLEFALRILREAAAHLQPGGLLVVEVGASQASLARRLPDLPLVWLEFRHGGEGVFLIGEEALRAHQAQLQADKSPVNPL